MSVTAIEGVVAAGRWPTWIIPESAITTEPSGSGPWSIPLSALTDPTAAKVDCHLDAGDVEITREAVTRERQRACQVVLEQIKTGETIQLIIRAVYDQQADSTEDVNAAYAALPEDTTVFVAQAFGWDSSLAPDSTTVVDLYKAKVQSRMKTQPTEANEDLKFQATLSGSNFWADVTLTSV